MFTGSGHVPYGMHDKFTEGVGGSNNGQTYFDWTRYYETDPSNYLETALWLESDRMGFLLDSLDEAKFNAQRDIVKNERRQSYDNQPYGRDDEVHRLAMYPQGASVLVADDRQHGRSHRRDRRRREAVLPPVLRAEQRDARRSSATSIPAQAKAWVAKYFADIPRGKPITRPTVGRPLTAEKRLTFEDRVQIPRLYIQWPSVGVHSDDQPALDLLSDILGGSRTARLTKALVYDKQIATASSTCSRIRRRTSASFDVIATPRPGHTLTELETQIDSVIAAFKREGPTADELKRAKAGQQLRFLNGLQSNLGKAFAARRRSDVLQRSEPLVPRRLSEDAGRHRRRRQARRQQVPRQRARRAEQRAGRQDRISRRTPTRARS